MNLFNEFRFGKLMSMNNHQTMMSSIILCVMGTLMALTFLCLGNVKGLSSDSTGYLVMTVSNDNNVYLVDTDDGTFVSEDLLDLSTQFNITNVNNQKFGGVALVCLN